MLYLEGEKMKNDYDKGLRHLSIACEKGHGAACATIGSSYLLARYGLEKDTGKATLLLGKGCELGSVSGCVNLSRMYATGDGVQRNDALAHKYKQLAIKAKAAHAGSAPGVNLGRTS